MHYQNELQFLLRYLKNHHINANFYTSGMDLASIDLELRQILGCETGYTKLQDFMLQQHNSNTIYKIIDQFHCVYYFMHLSEETPSNYFIIGPYMNTLPNANIIMQYVEKYSLPPQTFPQIQEKFCQIPILSDDTSLQTIIQTFGEIVWENAANFQFQILDYDWEDMLSYLSQQTTSADEYSPFDVQLLEAYTTQENALIQAVSQGQTAKAEDILSTIYKIPSADGAHDMLRNLKNFALILNTLFRKTSEINMISPHQILTVYAAFMQEIEQCSSPDACSQLLRKMVRKYCLLIKNHSMKQYSFWVQQVLKYIDMDLTTDLSLHAMAKKLNVNASYLSTHFKKITGTTYTEYVNRKRIEHAVFLLNTTSLQIQTIAQYCGIPDLNYFTKLFKKYVHKSPSVYRKEVLAK